MLRVNPARTLSAVTLVASQLLASPLAAPLAAQLAPARPQVQPHPLPEPALYLATTPAPARGGTVLALDDHAPWAIESLGATDGGELLRVFGAHVFVVNPWEGTLTRLHADGSAPPRVYDLGPSSEPRDVLVDGRTAWVTQWHEPHLLELDLASGAVTGSVDLGVLALPGEGVVQGLLARDGAQLFVQVGLVPQDLVDGEPAGAPSGARGLLAVIDLEAGALLDVDAVAPGLQGVALDGGVPHQKMQILEEARRLYVNSASSLLDNHGGIETVDLDTLGWLGYALREENTGDLGAFVMTSPAGGYFVFHTDIVASSHLLPFTVAGGPGAGPEMVVVLDFVDSLAYDVQRRRVYMPGGDAEMRLYAFSTLSNQPIAGTPIEIGAFPHDVVLVTE